MNQLTLSNDLNVITAEINSFKQVAGQAIFEIGKRLKHVKENDLSHGQFTEWLSSIEFDIYQASRFIKVYEELNDSKLRSGANIGFKALYEIATLHPDYRDQAHTIPSTGDLKTVDEMTVKELREVKKALKASEAAKAEAEQAVEQERFAHAEKLNELQAEIDRLKSIAIVSPEVQQRIEWLQSEVQKYSTEASSLRKTVEQMTEKLSKQDEDAHAVRKLREALRNMLISINTEHTNAGYFYSLIRGRKEAHEAVQTFLHDLDRELRKVFDHWTIESEIKTSEGGMNHVNNSVSARPRTIIDVVEPTGGADQGA